MDKDSEFEIPFRFNETAEAIVLTDRDGKILWFNPSFTILCGYEFSEVRQRKPGSFLQGPATDPQVVEQVRKSIRAGQGCAVQLTNYHKDGHSYPVQIHIEPIKNPGGEVKFFAAVERSFTPEETAGIGAEMLRSALHALLSDFVDSLRERAE